MVGRSLGTCDHPRGGACSHSRVTPLCAIRTVSCVYPTHSSLNPQPSTLNPSSLKPQPSTIDYKPRLNPLLARISSKALHVQGESSSPPPFPDHIFSLYNTVKICMSHITPAPTPRAPRTHTHALFRSMPPTPFERSNGVLITLRP